MQFLHRNCTAISAMVEGFHFKKEGLLKSTSASKRNIAMQR